MTNPTQRPFITMEEGKATFHVEAPGLNFLENLACGALQDGKDLLAAGASFEEVDRKVRFGMMAAKQLLEALASN